MSSPRMNGPTVRAREVVSLELTGQQRVNCYSQPLQRARGLSRQAQHAPAPAPPRQGPHPRPFMPPVPHTQNLKGVLEHANADKHL